MRPSRVIPGLLAALAMAGAARAQPVTAERASEAQTRHFEAAPAEPPTGLAGPAYVPGEPVPEGYHLESAPHTGMLGAGAVLLVFNYALAVVAARVDVTGGDAGDDPRSNDGSRNHGLYTPLFGPVIAAARDQTAGDRALILANGAGQLSGFSLVIGSLLLRELQLVPNVQPAFAPFDESGGVFSVRGSF
jgi:hypothetical protein